MGVLGHRFGEQAALVETDIPRRRADQPRNRVPLHVFRHVVAQQFDAHDIGKLAAQFGFADSGGPGEHEAANWFVATVEPGPGQLDRRRQ